MASRFSIETIFKAVDQMSAPSKRMQRNVGGIGKAAERSIMRADKALSGWMSSTRSFALGATVALAPVGFVLGDIIKTGAEFEQTLVNAGAKFPGMVTKGTAAFKLLADAARDVGRTTEFTASQAASGLNFLAMAGFNAEQAMAALPGLVDLATASQSDLARASDIATDTLGSFALLSDDAAERARNLARVNDVLVKTTNSSNTNLEQMFEALKKVGPAATAFGANIETTSAMVATLANVGIKGEESGTALRNIFLALAAPTSQAGKILKALNINLEDSSGNIRDVTDVFTDLIKGMGQLRGKQQLAAMDAIFGRRGVASSIVISKSTDALRGFRDMLTGIDGEAGRVADTMRNTLLGRWKTFLSAVESAKLSTFELSEGPLNEVVDRMTAWVRANETLIAQNLGAFMLWVMDNADALLFVIKGLVAAMALLVTVSLAVKTALALVKVFQALAWVVGIAQVAFEVFAGAVAIFGGVTVGIWIAAIAALIAAGIALYKYWEPIKEFFLDLYGVIVEKLVGGVMMAVDWFKKLIDLAGSIGGGIWDGVKSFFGFGETPEPGADGAQPGAVPAMVSPQERVARSIEERRSSADITIRDQTGRATIENQQGPFPGRLVLAPTGAM